MIHIDWLPVDPDNLPHYDLEVVATNGKEVFAGTFDKLSSGTIRVIDDSGEYFWITNPTHYVLLDDFLNSLPK